MVYQPSSDMSADTASMGDTLYKSYGLQSIRIAGALPHPSTLVQSAAMASVAPFASFRGGMDGMDRATAGRALNAEMSGRVNAADAHTTGAFLLAFRTVIFASAASTPLGGVVAWLSITVAGGPRAKQAARPI